ncbi:ABC transporter ATP-binding protein [Ktedonobacter sp. SOSP1-85]|uniref:ABC transporter ATP-binding protein n=1 Tax=Ktedonobacter sp. SOSP1-85 TaxID=2778367 RepID=UPI001916C74C|nr:ABC transporter ATP-binding protein [Ktedonobacter sp. SOSP1-85]GHO79994.1 ABC transporter ATP-binding protein [Ktedonobacter sp. SOSP1-85]
MIVSSVNASKKKHTDSQQAEKPQTLRRVWRVFRPYRIHIILIVIVIILTAAGDLVFPLLLPKVFDDAIAHNDMNHLLLYGLIMAISVGMTAFTRIAQTYLSSFVGQHVMRDMRNRLYFHLQELPFRFFTSTRVGEIQSRLSNDISGAQIAVTDIFVNSLTNVINTVGTIVAMFYLSPLLTIFSFLLLPIFGWITYKVGNVRRRLNTSTQQSLASLNALMQETLSVSGVLLIKTYGRKDFAKEQFEKGNQQLTNLGIRQQRVGRVFFSFMDTFLSLSPIAVYIIAGFLIINKIQLVSITVGNLIAFMYLQGMFFAPFSRLLSMQVELQGSLAIFDRIFEYLDLPNSIQDAPNALRLPAEQVRGEIRFRNVSFAYKNDEYAQFGPLIAKDDTKEASEEESVAQGENDDPTLMPFQQATLRNISFHIEPGQLVALVGPSGAGKTTITYLMSRLYDIDNGVIEIDGHDIREVELSSLNSLIGTVTQETYLFHMTIRENLLYVRPEATEDEMIAAAKAAAIHERILELDNGYDTLVGERGYRLSGGEKQRLALARILLKNPRILILDEATSSLDTHSERLIQTALEPLIKNHTTLAIAHRLSTILTADLILVLDHGSIVAQGTHQELLTKSELYADLYQKQFVLEKVDA